MAQSYFIAGDHEQGIEDAHIFIQKSFGMQAHANPDVMLLRHGLLSVDDARKIQSMAELSPTMGDTKILIITASRLFHEAQNALLKLFEEPPTGTILILLVPSEGMILPTLRSRLQSIQSSRASFIGSQNASAEVFLNAAAAERYKLITKLIERTKSDKEEEKQAARLAALQLLESLERVAHAQWIAETNQNRQQELQSFLEDLSRFIPILHERSAPLKLIFEHVQLVLPQNLGGV